MTIAELRMMIQNLPDEMTVEVYSTDTNSLQNADFKVVSEGWRGFGILGTFVILTGE
jgi:hypothetical protein